MMRPRGAVRLVLVLVVALAGWWQVRDRPEPSDRGTVIGRTAPAPSAAVAPDSPDAGGRRPPTAHPPRYDLGRDETLGGHTLSRHVGRTDDDLRQRLRDEPNIGAASTYQDRETAERVVSAALAANTDRLTTWAARPGRRPNLALEHRGPPDDIIGKTMVRGRTSAIPSTNAVVVLRWDDRRRATYVLTSYPEAR